MFGLMVTKYNIIIPYNTVQYSKKQCCKPVCSLVTQYSLHNGRVTAESSRVFCTFLNTADCPELGGKVYSVYSVYVRVQGYSVYSVYNRVQVYSVYSVYNRVQVYRERIVYMEYSLYNLYSLYTVNFVKCKQQGAGNSICISSIE